MENQLEIPVQEKEAGNKYWQENDYLNAGKSYSKALLAINHLIKEQKFQNKEQFEDMINNIQLPCLLNLSACYIKQGGGYQSVVQFCTDALKIDENNLKALYRRALAFTRLEKFKDAQKDLDAGLKLDPDNHSFIKIQAELNRRINNYKEKSKKIAKMTFESNQVPTAFQVEQKEKWWKCRWCRRKRKDE
jgi:tetratricopeptide (TPR) repeat protein